MQSDKISKKFLQILEYAHLAPSVHNVQPWQFSIPDDEHIVVHLDEDKDLAWSDPAKREAYISLGGCVENIRQATDALGMQVKSVRINDDEIRIKITENNKPQNVQKLNCIEQRFTDRSKFNSKEIGANTLEELSNVKPEPKTVFRVTDDEDFISSCTSNILKATKLAFSSKDFRDELAALTGPMRPKGMGFSSSSVGMTPVLGVFLPYILKSGLATAYQTRRDESVWGSSKGLVFVFSNGEGPEHWIRSGETYQRLGLKATGLGLRQSTSAALVEAADFHSDVEKHFNLENKRLQTVMRVGYSDSVAPKRVREPISSHLVT